MKTIIRITVTSLLLMLAAKFTQAQVPTTFIYGITESTGAGSIEIGNYGRGGREVLSSKDMGNFSIGAFMMTERDIFTFKTSLSYCLDQGIIKARENNYFTLHKLEMPFLFGGRVFGPISLEAGPVYNLRLRATHSFDSGQNNADFGRNGLGFRVGAGLNFHNFFIMSNFQRIVFAAPERKNSLRLPYQFTLSAGLKLFHYSGSARIDNKKYSITPGR